MPMPLALALLPLGFSVPARAASAKLAPTLVAKARAMDAECVPEAVR